MVLVTLSGSCVGSCRGARYEGSKTVAGGAKSCPFLVREDLSLVVSAMELQTVPQSFLGAKLVFFRTGPPGGLSISFPLTA